MLRCSSGRFAEWKWRIARLRKPLSKLFLLGSPRMHWKGRFKASMSVKRPEDRLAAMAVNKYPALFEAFRPQTLIFARKVSVSSGESPKIYPRLPRRLQDLRKFAPVDAVFPSEPIEARTRDCQFHFMTKNRAAAAA
jgi:hypothetical protein